MYLLRLDDASEYRDIIKWDRIETLLDKYQIKPIVGVIPHNQDPSIINKYKKDSRFWEVVKKWNHKNWTIGLHGYNHVYITNVGGLNPVNNRSEFAGVDLAIQKEKIRKGLSIFKEQNISPKAFFAPAHTFDHNTLRALHSESNIRVISDTIANDVYNFDGFYFIPQQTGHVRSMPFKITTFCYHPNNMIDKDYIELENFLLLYQNHFVDVGSITLVDRSKSSYDNVLSWLYFFFRKMRKRFKNCGD